MARKTIDKASLTALAEAMTPEQREACKLEAASVLKAMPTFTLPAVTLTPVPFNGGRYGWGDASVEVESPHGKVTWYPIVGSPKAEKDEKSLNIGMQLLATERSEVKTAVINVKTVSNAFAKMSKEELNEVIAANRDVLLSALSGN